jgi:hypothetical protein
MGDDLLDQQAVEELLRETFGLDVNKSSFMLEKWNESWSEALSHKKSARLSPLSPLPLPLPLPIPSSSLSSSSRAEKEKEIEEDGFREIAQKLNPLSRSLDYYIGRETTDRDTEDQFKSWKMIKRYMESRDPRVQSQRNHFGISPERELDFAQASFCPTETRICTLSLSSSTSSSSSSSSSSPSAERKYVMTSAGASWDILFSSSTSSTSSTSSSSSTPPQTKDTARKYTETFLSILDNYPSIFSFFRREIEKQNLQIETISASEIRKQRDLFNRSRHDEFFNSDGFCVKDQSGTCIAMATCSKSVFDPSISLNLTEDDAVDCSHLPFYGSNFSEEDKFEFASKSGLRMFVWLHPDLEEAKSYLASMLALIVIEANAENSFVSIALDCEKSLCPQLSQTLGFFRTFSVSAKDLKFKGFEIYDVSKAPPVQIQDHSETQFSLFRIFLSASQVLGSALLLWLQLNEKEKNVFQGGKKMKAKDLQGDRRPPFRPRAAEEDSLTTIENSAIRFDKSVDVWKGNINSLRDQLVEEEK